MIMMPILLLVVVVVIIMGIFRIVIMKDHGQNLEHDCDYDNHDHHHSPS